MPTRPGYVWDATASQWVEIGQAAVLAPVKYQATAPSSPATGDIWIESDVDVPSIDSAQFLRWRKTMVGGETSLSGNDDSSLPLAYTPGYEQLYINGVLQVRGQDYTATTGTTVTGLTALVANDVVEIFSAVARTVADVYTQTQSDARFVNRNVGGLNLAIPSSVVVGSGSSTLSTNGQVTFTGASSVSLNGCFNSTYANYKVILNITGKATGAQLTIRPRANGVDLSSGSVALRQQSVRTYGTTIDTSYSSSGTSSWVSPGSVGSGQSGMWSMEFMNPFTTANTYWNGQWFAYDGFNFVGGSSQGALYDNNLYDGFTLSASGTVDGTIRIYGYNNGA